MKRKLKISKKSKVILLCLLCFVIAFLAAVVCTIAELCTKGGFDTITCPSVAMVIIIPLVKILGG